MATTMPARNASIHAPIQHAGHQVSFEALLDKVKQAETALEARERQAAADWRQVKASWREGWTPWRIVVAGLVAGFAVGTVEPVRRVARGGGVLQLASALAGLFAGGSAQAAAGEAEHAARTAEQVAAAADARPVKKGLGVDITPP